MKTRCNLVVLVASSMLLALLVGCGGEPSASDAPSATVEAAEPANDAYAEVLRLANTGETDAAIERFVNEAPEHWIESTSLQVYELSESNFAKLSRTAKNDMQQKFIDHVGEVKTLSRAVVDRANELNQSGDTEVAKKYIQAVHQLGQQLQDSDIVLVLQQTGMALTGVSLDE